MLFCAKTIVKESSSFELVCLKKKKKKNKKKRDKNFLGMSGNFLVQCLPVFTQLGMFLVMKHSKMNDSCHKGL